MPGWRLVGRGRKGEVGIAARVEQDFELRVHAAPASVAPRVGEAPVSVNEGVARATVRVAREVTVLGVGREVARGDRSRDAAASSPSWCRWTSTSPKPAPTSTPSASRYSRSYCSPGKKKLWRGGRPSASRNPPASRGYPSTQRRTRSAPQLPRSAAPERLVVIAHRDEQMRRTVVVPPGQLSQQVARVAAEPAVHVAVWNTGQAGHVTHPAARFRERVPAKAARRRA